MFARTVLIFFVFIAFSASAQISYSEDYNTVSTISKSQYEDLAAYESDAQGRVSAGIMSFHENGAMEEKGFIMHGKKQGLWLKYNNVGMLISKAHYRNGVKSGTWSIWDDNGTLRVRMYYNEGERVGTWSMFDAQGKLAKQELND